MSRFWAGDPVFSRIARWTANLSFTLSTANEWKELTLTLPEAVDWSKTVLWIDGKSFYRQVVGGGATAASYGVQWRPKDANSATIFIKCGVSGAKTWAPTCELWICSSDYNAYHLHGNWDTATGAGSYTLTATCGDAVAAARAVMWLPDMEFDVVYAAIPKDNANVRYAHVFRDASNNSCLTYTENYGSSNIYYSFTYVYKS